MCGVCGCGRPGDATIEHEHVGADGVVVRHAHAHGEGHEHAHGAGDHSHEHEHVGPDGAVLRHAHDHAHDAGHAHAHGGEEHAHAARVLRIEEDILAKNAAFARENRARFAAAGTFVLNLMSSPGAGKTTLLVRTLRALAGRATAAVIEGDQQTSLDADRIRATGAAAVQINTGKVCHLDAAMVGRALGDLPPFKGVLFVENVGNLVCPAGFDLGEHRRVLVASVTEGEDKPLKYPDMFAVADAVLINKVDLLPYLSFDVGKLADNARKVKPGVPIFPVSATTGEGFEAWIEWVLAGG